jgi:hypothetical protein
VFQACPTNADLKRKFVDIEAPALVNIKRQLTLIESKQCQSLAPLLKLARSLQEA